MVRYVAHYVACHLVRDRSANLGRLRLPIGARAGVDDDTPAPGGPLTGRKDRVEIGGGHLQSGRQVDGYHQTALEGSQHRWSGSLLADRCGLAWRAPRGGDAKSHHRTLCPCR